MRILILTEFFPEYGELTGGVETRAYHIAKELGREHDVHIITSRRPGQEKTAKDGAITIQRVGLAYPYTHTGHNLRRIFFTLKSILTVRKYCTNHDIDVVDGYNFYAYLPALFSPKKIFLTYHEVWIGSWVENTGRFLGIIGEVAERLILFLSRLRRAKFIAVSDFTKRALLRQGISPSAVQTVPNGVLLPKGDERKKYTLPTICVVGRLVPHKRVEDILSAVPLIMKKIPDIRIIIIGKGPQRQNLELFAKNQTILARVRFLGFVDQAELHRIMGKSHIYCSASVLEGFGITLLEAAAQGTPFVCTDIEPFREVARGAGGLFFRPRDPHDLAAKVISLLAYEGLYREKKTEAISLARKYQWRRIAKQVLAAYRKM